MAETDEERGDEFEGPGERFAGGVVFVPADGSAPVVVEHESTESGLSEAIDKVAQLTEPLRYAVASILASILGADLLRLLQTDPTIQNAIRDIGDDLSPLTRAIDSVRDDVETLKARAAGHLDLALLGEAVKTLRRAHAIAMIVSPAYREQIEGLYTATRQLSRSIFGDASTVNSGLMLVQMATYDLSRVSGEPIDLAENRYFASAHQLALDTERRSRTYSRNPGAFWYDLNIRYLRPLEIAAQAKIAERDGRIDALDSGLTSTTGLLAGLDGRFLAYTQHLAPFLTDDKIAQLEDIRRDFKERVRDPLRDLDTFIETEFPIVEVKVAGLANEVGKLGLDVSQVVTVTDDPSRLDDRARIEQRARINAWLDSAASDTGGLEIARSAAAAELQSVSDALNAE